MYYREVKENGDMKIIEMVWYKAIWCNVVDWYRSIPDADSFSIY